MNTPAILQQLQASRALPASLQNIKQMLGMVRSANDPQAMLRMLAQNNPDVRQALDFIGKCDNSPEKAFYALAQQKGINPQAILDLLK